MALIPAAETCFGVSKSGWPISRCRTFFPCASRAWERARTAYAPSDSSVETRWAKVVMGTLFVLEKWMKPEKPRSIILDARGCIINRFGYWADPNLNPIPFHSHLSEPKL